MNTPNKQFSAKEILDLPKGFTPSGNNKNRAERRQRNLKLGANNRKTKKGRNKQHTSTGTVIHHLSVFTGVPRWIRYAGRKIWNF